jgi:hypothetical protein
MAIRTAVNRALTAITALPTAAALTDGNLTLLTTATASSSATLDFTSSINSTYNSYLFKFINIHAATNTALLNFQTDTGTNTSYNQTVTSTSFRANQNEADGGAAISYRTGSDQAQGTAFEKLSQAVSNDNDSGISGFLQLFNPSSTTFVKHFIGTSNTAQATPESQATYYAGYFNTTTALTRVRFKMSSGNMDSGTIKMYGVGPKQ